MERQRRFVTDAGHELKTPLAVILANLDAMELRGGENKYSRNIRSQTSRLSMLMQNLLTLARLDENTPPPDRSTLSLSELTKEAAEIFRTPAELKKLRLETEIREEVKVLGNRQQLQQLLSTLLDNAVKYCPEGGVIRVKLRQEDRAVLAIANTVGEESQTSTLLQHVGIIAELARTLAPQLDQREQFGLLRSLELPVSRVLYGMESQGAKVDMHRLDTMRDTFAAEARQAQEIAWDFAGTNVNLQSPKQLGKLLFEDMGLKPTKRTKTGGYTTNADALQKLYFNYASDERASGFLGALLKHRETNKLKQIVATLIDATNPSDERIHTTFEQTVAATGRLSSVDPNLQNIPNRNAAGREIRSAFVPGEGFESLMSCDYSQVELRIMAHLSGDESLIEAFKSGVDFHKYVASLVHGVPVDQITPDQRSHVKAMSYGLAYGLSSYGLAQQLKIRPSEADALKAKYFATFGKVHDFLESCVSRARELGYTETMFGRRRYFPALRSTNRAARDAAERAALNAPIQGSAADIMKIAMIRASKALADAGMNSRIILQIHDELVVEIAPGETEQVTALVRDAMENAVHLDVPLDVSTGVGADWQLAAH